MTPVEQARLIGNIVASIRTVSRDIQARQIQHFFKADPKYGQGVAEGLGQKLEEVLSSKKGTIRGALKNFRLGAIEKEQ